MFAGAPQVPKFILGREGARQLATALRDLLPMTLGFRWDFGQIFDNDYGVENDEARDALEAKGVEPCGTVGCAMGYAALIWPEEFPIRDNWDSPSQFNAMMMANLGMPEDVADAIFWGAGKLYEALQRKGEDITPAMVAEQIEAWLVRAAAVAA